MQAEEWKGGSVLGRPLRAPEVGSAVARLAWTPSIVEALAPKEGADYLRERAAPVFLREQAPARGVVFGPAASLGPASRSRDAATAWPAPPPFQARIGDGR